MSVLDQIISRKIKEVSEFRSSIDIHALAKRAFDSPPCADFIDAIVACEHTPIIAEIKKRSPSKRSIAKDINVEERAMLYQDNGAAAVSVLTDEADFGGSIFDLDACASALEIPSLRKDFIIDEAQLFESRIAGADAVLLIGAALSADKYAMLLNTTIELGMTPLTEVHNLTELKAVLPFKPPLIGINNRNLHTLKVDINVTKELINAVPSSIPTICESGIENRQQIDQLLSAGVKGFLIGTALMTSSDPALMLRKLAGI